MCISLKHVVDNHFSVLKQEKTWKIKKDIETKKATLLCTRLQFKPYQMGFYIRHRGNKHNFARLHQKNLLLYFVTFLSILSIFLMGHGKIMTETSILKKILMENGKKIN